MNRKRTAMVWVLALACSLVLLGCPKKKPAPPEVVEPPKPEAPPTKEVAPPEAPKPMDQTPDPLDQELIEVQKYLESSGLIGDVFFDFDKFDLKPEARERLAKNADFMKKNPQFVFTIEGHCDERGTNEYNIALGDRRANAAKNYLDSLGVSGGHKTVTYGEERPFCEEHNEGCWWRNRRAHFVVTGRTDR